MESHGAQEGLLGLEQISEKGPFCRKGGSGCWWMAQAESIRYILELELGSREQLEIQGAKVFDAMGGYAPTLGILGAVLGLIHVMGNLSDPQTGAGIATAFVATIYGVAFANLIFPGCQQDPVSCSQQTHYRGDAHRGHCGNDCRR